MVLTSSSLRLCSFCSSMRFWRSARSCLLCSSFSLCCCSSCWRRRASERSLLASCSLRKSRRSVDSPGRFRMELWTGKKMRVPTMTGTLLLWVLVEEGCERTVLDFQDDHCIDSLFPSLTEYHALHRPVHMAPSPVQVKNLLLKTYMSVQAPSPRQAYLHI